MFLKKLIPFRFDVTKINIMILMKGRTSFGENTIPNWSTSTVLALLKSFEAWQELPSFFLSFSKV